MDSKAAVKVNKSSTIKEVKFMKEIGLLPCSGACNVGMLSNKAVVDTLEAKEDTDFVCALGLPLGIEGIINNGQSSDNYIAVNGCKVGCASKALASADISVDQEVVLTEDFAIEKNKDFKAETKLDQITEELKNSVDELQTKRNSMN